MFDTLKKLMSGPKAASAADIRTALAELDTNALDAAVDAAKADVSEAILSGAERAVEKAEDALETAHRNRDRALIARAELQKRLTAAEAAEADATLSTERDAAETEAKAVAAILWRDWTSLQTKMTALLSRLNTAEEAVQAVNAKLATAGRTDTVDAVEWRARPRPTFAWEGTVSIAANVALPEIAEWSLAGYGPALNVSTAFYHEPHRGSGSTDNWPAPHVASGPLTTFPTNY